MIHCTLYFKSFMPSTRLLSCLAMTLPFGHLLNLTPVPSPRVHSGPVPAPRVSLILHFSHLFTMTWLSLFNPVTGNPETINSLLAGADSKIWLKSLANKNWQVQWDWQNLENSMIQVLVTTLYFIRLSQLPADCNVTYSNFVCTICVTTSEAHSVWIIVRGD